MPFGGRFSSQTSPFAFCASNNQSTSLLRLILRVKQPELERPYKTPFIYFVAPMGVAFNIFLMSQVRENTWYAFLIWGTLGVIIYFLYSRKHSNLNKAE